MDFLVKDALKNMSSEELESVNISQAQMAVIGCGRGRSKYC